MILIGLKSSLRKRWQMVENEQNRLGQEQDMPNFYWTNGLTYYLEHIQHPQFKDFNDIKLAVQEGNAWKVRDIVEKEIHRGPIDLTTEFLKIIFNKWTGYDYINHRKYLQYISYCIDDPFIKKISSWSIKWQERANLNDHFSRGQMMSKMWLVDGMGILMSDLEMGYDIDTVVQYGGWYATVAHFLFENFDIKRYYSFEIDEGCHEVADDFNYQQTNNEWQFKSIPLDCRHVPWELNEEKGYDYLYGTAYNRTGDAVNMKIVPKLIINTSCEHMDEKWFYDLPQGMPVILQTNDYFSNDQHVNCVNSIEEALEKYQFGHVTYSGELDTGLYKRFMIAGTR